MTEKTQDTLILCAAVNPVLASPLYFMAYLGWAMSGGSSSSGLKEVIIFSMVPVMSLALLTIVIVFGNALERKRLGIIVAAVLSLGELLFGAKITGIG